MDPILGRFRKGSPEDIPVGVPVGPKLTCLLEKDLRKVSPWVSTFDPNALVCSVYSSEPCSELPLGDGVPVGVHVGSKLNRGKYVGTRVGMKN
eukprot:scaffold101479_cov44-Attheya_sp.AAC.2